MSNKILMAEGLDLIRDAEAREFDCDKRLEHIKDNMSKLKKDLSKVVHDYESVYRQYIQGLEVLNSVRHRVLDSLTAATASQSKQLSDFCASKMSYYMDHCESLKKKLNTIFLPVTAMVVPMDGFSAGAQLMREDGITLKANMAAVERQFDLSRGTYVLTISYLNDYTMVSPELHVTVIVEPNSSASVRWERRSTSVEVPSASAWRHLLATTGAHVTVRITVKGVREVLLSATLTEWQSPVTRLTLEDPNHTTTAVKPQTTGTALTPAAGSKLSAAAAAPADNNSGAMLKRLQVNPRGMTCGGRLDLISLVLDSWPGSNVSSAVLQREPQVFIQNLFELPMPTDLS